MQLYRCAAARVFDLQRCFNADAKSASFYLAELAVSISHSCVSLRFAKEQKLRQLHHQQHLAQHQVSEDMLSSILDQPFF
jgi:hypothetical protein